MTTQNTIRPSDPSQISFAAECFESAGTCTEYSVCLSAPNYPRNFGSDKAAAEAYALKVGRVVTERTVQINRRVRWY